MTSKRRLGVVLRFYSNLLVVEDLETGKQYLCKLRGKFKKQGIRPITGDTVEFTPIHGDEGVVENILHRRSELKKPSVANVDQVIVVTTLRKPEVPLEILDRFIVLVEREKLPLVLVLNKIDLLERDEITEFEKIYGNLYPLVKTSAVTKEGISELKEYLQGKISVFAGMSGVGKSSLLNAIDENLKLRTGEISEKLERGRHTTTTAQLLRVRDGGWVVDTPGFASLELEGIEPEELRYLFIEFENDKCFFPDCVHLDEPECFVKMQVMKGKLPRSRYESYVKMLKEIQEKAFRKP
ncbi:ribosome small subunit-dependent GTPase A [Fervidobacterium thailandense]|uniref:Small ribosomal subunit biogenesis GTPase RsgA n=1 Tax=Fervidobacterium thailandense TaxID=1008305 RepID=A0A1E3G4D4_9BACT|nr:ribosome small subunit-dependent GTPase A [Fervidobacterium thailandense]ODN31099.1 ribosome small subunit-dependent GTPase A [Fervidobacterium thailandense]